MTGTQATIQANDNPRCSPPHYNVQINATDGSFARNCGPPVNSNTTTFQDNSPAAEVTVQITELAQC